MRDKLSSNHQPSNSIQLEMHQHIQVHPHFDLSGEVHHWKNQIMEGVLVAEVVELVVQVLVQECGGPVDQVWMELRGMRWK